MSYRTQQRERDRRDPRAAEVVALYRSGRTAQEIGERFGLSPARAKDLIIANVPDEERQATRAARRDTGRAERRAERLLAELLRRCAEATPCVICGAWVLRSLGKKTCSRECASSWVDGRYHLSDSHREAHRRAQARLVLSNPAKYGRWVAWAEAVLSDNPPPPNRRFTVPGSAASRAAAVARSGAAS